MVCNKKFRIVLVCLTLVVLPMNFQVITQSSTFVQEFVDAAPTIWASSNSTTGDRKSYFPPSFEFAANVSNFFASAVDSIANSLSDVQVGKVRVATQEGVSSRVALTAIQQEAQQEPHQNNGQLVTIPSKNDPNTFAGCIQVMDDNHFIIEWLAYHYHVMPLRRLIIFTDPHSRTSPQPILDRWQDRINITLWDSEKYVYPQGVPNRTKKFTSVGEHRSRQRQFVRRCLQAFHKEGREWVFIIDSDEYAMINERVKDSKDFLSPATYAGKNMTIPEQDESGSVLKLLKMKDAMNPHTNETLLDTPCITVGRKVFGTNEEELPESFLGFDPLDFQTMRWRRWSDAARPGKSLVNLKHVKFKDIPQSPSIHRPFTADICKGKMWMPEDLSVIIVNHYPGTLKQLLFRQHDARGEDGNATAYRVERFEAHKKFSIFLESERVNQWLRGFIESVGEAEARRLLEHAGQPEEASGVEVPTTVSPQSQLEKPSKEVLVITESPAQDLHARTFEAQSAPAQEASNSITSKDDPDGFAGCLQVMDDNHFLVEWIAYHYHVMPMRRLIIFTDPHSRTVPDPILDRWKDRINITLWHEKDVYPNGIPPLPDPKKVHTFLGQHRGRQRKFVKLCLQTLHKEGREWVFSTDTDEYTMINDRVRNPTDKLSRTMYLGEKNISLPSQREPASVLKFLKMKDIVIPRTGQHFWDNPCITMARKTFGTKAMVATGKTVAGYTVSDFQTLNWRYYVDDGKPGKTVINLKHVTYKQIPRHPSVHRPLTSEGMCQGAIAFRERESLLVVNHYPGNLQQMLYRVHDSRGNHTNATAYRVERFNDYKKKVKHTEKETIQAWLPGFVDSVGEKEAVRLLQYVGQPDLAGGTPVPPVEIHGDNAELARQPPRQSDQGEKIAVSQRSFAACLHVSDDNHFLVEWLAYHYHVLPLQRLIVFKDPQSRTSPAPILERWKDRMQISLWDENNANMDGTGSSLDQYKSRQRQFAGRCLRLLHSEGQGWVLINTVNEYTMINDNMREPGHKLSPEIGVVVPSQAEPGSVFNLLHHEDVKIPLTGQPLKDNPCITMARKDFGTKETDESSYVLGFNSSDFQTLNWRYYSDEGKAGKSMINLRQISFEDIPTIVSSVNRPFRGSGICKGDLRLKERQSVFLINRYPGNLQQTLFKAQVAGHGGNATTDAADQSQILAQKFANVEKESIQSWLKGFIRAVGEEEASRLLKSVGQPQAASAPV